MANETFSFSILVVDAPDSGEALEEAISRFAETFHMETDIAGQILRSAPVIFIKDVTRSEVSEIKDYLIQLSNGPLSFRISSADLPPLPEVVWPETSIPDFDKQKEGETISGVHIDYHGNAVTCPECEEIMVLKQTNVDLPTADSTGHDEMQTASTSSSSSSSPKSTEAEGEVAAEPETIETEDEMEEDEEPTTVPGTEEEIKSELSIEEEDEQTTPEVQEPLEPEQEESDVSPIDELDEEGQGDEQFELDEEEENAGVSIEAEGNGGEQERKEASTEPGMNETVEPSQEASGPESEEDGEEIMEMEENQKQPSSEQTEQPSGTSDNGNCNVFISSVSDEKKEDLIPLLTQFRGCSESEAEDLTNRPITPVLNGISEGQAEEIKKRFEEIGVSVNITTK